MRFHKPMLAGAFALFYPAWGSAQTLPDGPGKERVQQVCTTCHEIETVVATRRTKIGWQRMVEDMVARGAEASDEDMAAVVEYLTAAFGKVNVNTASAQDLEKALGLSEKEARAITAYREKNGNYKSFEELEKTPDVDSAKLRLKRNMIAFSQ